MGVSLHWDESQPSVIILTLIEEWTFREALAQYERALQIAKKVPTGAVLLIDFTQTSYLPPTGLMETLTRASQMTAPLHVHIIGRILAMPPSSVRDMLAAACQRVIKPPDCYRLLIANNLPEAYQQLAQQLSQF